MVYYGGMLIADSDLNHHGILGQKWGRRNGPPYPLGSSAHSSAEKKAGWQKSLKGNKPSGGSLSKSPKKQASGGLFKKKQKEPQMTSEERQKKYEEDTRKYFSEHKEELYKEAKEKDMYDMEFLERYPDNEDGTKDSKRMLNEYKKYLEDPINYNRGSNQSSAGLLGPSKKELKKQAKIDKKTRETLAEMKKNDPEKYKQLKENTIRKGTAKEINYFVNDMTNDEIQNAITRLDKKAQLSKLANNDVKDIWSKLDNTTAKMKTIADFTQQAANIYSNLNRMTLKQNNQNNQKQNQASAGLFDKSPYAQDKKTARKLNRNVKSSQKMLTYRARAVADEHKEYDKAADRYSKALYRPVLGLTKKSRDERRTERAEWADKEMQNLGKKMETRERELQRAKTIHDDAVKNYKEHINNMKSKYGDTSIKDVSSKTITVGTREYESVKTTLMPVTMKYASRELADKRRKEVEAIAKRPHV